MHAYAPFTVQSFWELADASPQTSELVRQVRHDLFHFGLQRNIHFAYANSMSSKPNDACMHGKQNNSGRYYVLQ